MTGMRVLVAAGLAAVAILLVWLLGSWERLLTDEFKEETPYCSGVRAIDGDTVSLPPGCIAGVEFVHLLGVDAPDLRSTGGTAECFAADSKRELEAQLREADEVQFIYDSSLPRRRGEQAIRVVQTDIDVGQYLIRHGFARVGSYDGRITGHLRMYREAERAARSDRAGIWSKKCPPAEKP